jgi:hypothetical protein
MSIKQLHQSFVLASAFAAVLAIAVRAEDGPSRHDADLLQQKITAIGRFGDAPAGSPHRTAITETELNAYLKLDARQSLPAGVIDPSVTIVGTGRVTGRALVDLDTMKQRRSRGGLFDPMSLLGGRVAVTATGVLKTSEGVGHFLVESAAVGSLPIPKTLLQEIVGYYSRTPESPAGISLDDPFALPARIREIQVEPGQAIVVQ